MTITTMITHGLHLWLHDHDHDHHHHHHEHRNLFDVNKIIDESDIDEKAKELAKRIFLRVAKAESKVHNETLENVPDPDATVKSLCYCLCLSPNTRDRLENFFDFHAMQPKPECLKNDALSEDDEKQLKWHSICFLAIPQVLTTMGIQSIR